MCFCKLHPPSTLYSPAQGTDVQFEGRLTSGRLSITSKCAQLASVIRLLVAQCKPVLPMLGAQRKREHQQDKLLFLGPRRVSCPCNSYLYEEAEKDSKTLLGAWGAKHPKQALHTHSNAIDFRAPTSSPYVWTTSMHTGRVEKKQNNFFSGKTYF